MARLARLIVPGVAHHITQRGNRRQRVFLSDADKSLYVFLLAGSSASARLRWLAYCLMDNHVHLIGIPNHKGDFADVLGETHRKYTTIINIREKWKGHLWQGRFGSSPLDEAHLFAAIRYVERNPVRAGLVEKAWDYPWSSARAHVHLRDDGLLAGTRAGMDFGDWGKYLEDEDDEKLQRAIRLHERTGRPLGNDEFLIKLEGLTGRTLRKKRPGPRNCPPIETAPHR